ncbi:Short chain dehydrogenase AgnL6 [Psilocybe cubensis]|uniref:Short chain dehydrogenase AgnL6 n=1 Tax=Psilocybe cubensis TaxID=181762 RepID=A0ACB8GYY2_PSICU|nr:Short chain dehydrogenase AgnL6 [Psilocybe cubensis]KAH9480848.1 Short chain dehydrogenase AgnL6 [Psilocybe cubensis]
MPGTVANFFNAVRPNSSNNRLGVPSKMNKQFSSSSMFLATTSLHGKVAVVTGSSRSIGASIAKCLGDHGANVVVNYVKDAAAADEVVQAIRSQGKGGAIAVKADTSTLEGGQFLLDEAVKTFGKVDILVLNAGVMGSKTLSEIDEAFFDSHFDINVKAPLFMAKAAASILPTPGGRIIFFSSSLTAASTVTPNALCYLASKGAIEQISRVLAKDLGSRGITVNTVSPGPVDTPMFREGKPQSVLDSIAKQNPLRRLGEPDDIAPIVGFLASQAAQWVNGQNIRVNGRLRVIVFQYCAMATKTRIQSNLRVQVPKVEQPEEIWWDGTSSTSGES